MKGASRRDAGAVFYPLRSSLVRVADRLPGSVADAEDVVQHAFPRWLDVDVDRGAVREPAAFLRRVVRACAGRVISRVTVPSREARAVALWG
jgi:RNA polymerase sigma-70 factor, ECF subfamily